MRNEIYYLPLGIYDLNIKAIKVAQCQWLQQAVIARDDRNGFYSPGMLSPLILYSVRDHVMCTHQQELWLKLLHTSSLKLNGQTAPNMSRYCVYIVIHLFLYMLIMIFCD